MNELNEILSIDAVEAGLHAGSKKALFQQLSLAAGPLCGIQSKKIVTALNAREKVGSTGFGSGVAIPHGRIEGIERVFGFFARLDPPVDYHAIDGIPVDLVFMLLSPPDAGADHLKALASVSRTLRDRQTVANLRGARSKDALFAVLAGTETRNAA